MKLKDDSTHFQCASCNKIKAIALGKILKVAYSIFEKISQTEFAYRPHLVMVCEKCLRLTHPRPVSLMA